MTSDYANFAVTTAKDIVQEETDRLEREIMPDMVALLDTWSGRLGSRINARMESVGIDQVLEIEVEWDLQTMPTFKFKGYTQIGATEDE